MYPKSRFNKEDQQTKDSTVLEKLCFIGKNIQKPVRRPTFKPPLKQQSSRNNIMDQQQQQFTPDENGYIDTTNLSTFFEARSDITITTNAAPRPRRSRNTSRGTRANGSRGTRRPLASQATNGRSTSPPAQSQESESDHSDPVLDGAQMMEEMHEQDDANDEADITTAGPGSDGSDDVSETVARLIDRRLEAAGGLMTNTNVSDMLTLADANRKFSTSKSTRTSARCMFYAYATYHTKKDPNFDPFALTAKTPEHINEYICKKCDDPNSTDSNGQLLHCEGRSFSVASAIRTAISFFMRFIHNCGKMPYHESPPGSGQL